MLNGELIIYKSSLNGRRECCPDCGTHILVHGPVADSFVAVAVGMLDVDHATLSGAASNGRGDACDQHMTRLWAGTGSARS